MANFEKPADWSVAPAGDWVSKKPLQDRGAPQLGDPGYAEKSSCECDTEEYDEGDAAPDMTGKKFLTSKGFQGHCPPHQKADPVTGVCMPNPESEAKTPFTAQGFERDDEDDKGDKKGWALDTLPLLKREKDPITGKLK